MPALHSASFACTVMDTKDAWLNRTVPHSISAEEHATVTTPGQVFITPELSAQPAGAFIKTTVSQLKQEGHPVKKFGHVRQDVYEKPQFARDGVVLAAAERGTATHVFLQHLPIEAWSATWQTLSPAEKRSLLQARSAELETCALLTAAQAEALDLQTLSESLDGDLGEYFWHSIGIRRETPFLLKAERREGGSVLVQGVIDVIGEDENGRFLLDFKTDYLPGDYWEQELKERYLTQMAVYARAAGELAGRPVSRVVVFSLYRRRGVIFSASELQREWERFFRESDSGTLDS
jgi:ATP-dependent helicase/nuclease subunit A